VDALSRVVAAAMRLIEEGALSQGENAGTIDDLARALGVSGRHLRRAMQAELGVSPIALAASRRLALARQLIVDTGLPMTEVAFAAGYRSVRRFNAAVRARYARPPSAMRRTMRAQGGGGGGADETLTVMLHYRPPYDWPSMLSYFVARAMPGIELVRDGVYLRTAAVGGLRRLARGHRRHDPPGAAGEDLDVAVGRAAGGGRAVAAPLRSRRRSWRDRRAPGARSAVGGARARAARLARHRRVRPLRGGGRAPCWDSRSVSRPRGPSLGGSPRCWGRRSRRPHPELGRLFPAAGDHRPRANAGDIAALGIPGRRAATLLAIARAVSRGELALDGAGDPARIVEQRSSRCPASDRGPPTTWRCAGSAGPTLSRRGISACARRWAASPGGRRAPPPNAGDPGAPTAPRISGMEEEVSHEQPNDGLHHDAEPGRPAHPRRRRRDDLIGLFFDGEANTAPRAEWTGTIAACARPPSSYRSTSRASARASICGSLPGGPRSRRRSGRRCSGSRSAKPPATATSRARSASPPRRARSAAPTTAIRSRSSSPATV
jgi:AraC-like DNA-binding protein